MTTETWNWIPLLVHSGTPVDWTHSPSPLNFQHFENGWWTMLMCSAFRKYSHPLTFSTFCCLTAWIEWGLFKIVTECDGMLVIGKDSGVFLRDKWNGAKHRHNLRGKVGSVCFPPDTVRQIHLSAGQQLKTQDQMYTGVPYQDDIECFWVAFK